jgi:hypothetical protein
MLINSVAFAVALDALENGVASAERIPKSSCVDLVAEGMDATLGCELPRSSTDSW